MKFDYIPAARPRGRAAQRIILTATLCAVSVAVLMSRETVARRQLPATIGDIIPADALPDQALARAMNYDQTVQAVVADPIEVPRASDWVTVTVRPGQSLSTIFDAQGIASDDWMALLKLGGDCLQLKRLNVGDQLKLRVDGDQLVELSYEIDATRTLQVRRVDDGFESYTMTAALERRETTAGGIISSSLFVDGQKAGVSARMLMDLAELFGYDVDFALDLRRGDRFAVVYDGYYKDGVKVRDGELLAAEFVNKDRVYRAVRHVDSAGNAAYYTPAGMSLRTAFIRTPIDFARISSPFNLQRRHPILNTIRAHKGVDYAAASGTPIKATGDGKVTFVGVKGGYGNVVIIQHGAQYQTLYGHLSRFRPGLTVGSRVQQSQVIGYVGQTGLATGPHLHYEFRINGHVVNPVTVALPRANSLDRTEMARFKTESTPWVAQMDRISQTQLAQLHDAADSDDEAGTGTH